MNPIIIVVLLVLIYIYAIKFNHPEYKVVQYRDIKNHIKTGDMILFTALDSPNQIFMISYITHVGVVYKKDADTPAILIESFNHFHERFYPDEYDTGIATSNLEHRLNSYRGYILYKELAKPVPQYANEDFAEFIKYSKENMKYDKNVVTGEVGKILFNTPFTKDTNCGQFTTLILMKLNLLDFSYFKDRQRHHLRFVTQLTHLKNNSYKVPVYVYSNYFKLPINDDTY